MATIKGIKGGNSIITASYKNILDETISSSVTLYVLQATIPPTYNPVVVYPKNAANGTATTLYCTYAAEAKNSTVSAYAIGLTNSPTSSVGQTCTCDTTPVVKNSGGTSISGWTVSSDGKTLTVPQNTAPGTYTVTITARAAEIVGSYDASSTTATITVTVTATSISVYEDVSNITFNQKTNLPASEITLTNTNISTYVTPSATQTIIYNNAATRAGSVTISPTSGLPQTIASLGTTPTAAGSVTLNPAIGYTATGEGSNKTATGSVTSLNRVANSEGTTHYKAATGATTGDNWTYGTPTAVQKVYGIDMLHTNNTSLTGSPLNTDVVKSSVTDTKQYYLEWTSGSRKSHSENIAGTVGFAFASQTTNGSNTTTAFTLGAVSNNQAQISHRDIGAISVDSVTDACSVYAYNTNDNTKKTTGSNNATWSIVNNRTKVLDGYKSYGTPILPDGQGITIGTGFTAANGSATITCGSVTNERYYHYTYTDSTHNESANAHYENEAGTARWCITKQYIGTAANSTTGTTITRFTNPASGSSNLNIGGKATATYASGTKVSHSTMTTNIGFDIVEVTAYNILDTTKTASAKLSTNSNGIENKLTWSAPTITKANASLSISNDTASKSLAADGKESFTFAPTITQSGSYTSGSTASNTKATYTYEVTSTGSNNTGFSGTSVVTASNNTSTSARGTYTVKITATATPDVTGTGSYSDTASVNFTQVAGAKVYEKPTVTAYAYDTFAAGGATKTPSSLGYSQDWTWNGVAGSGGTLTSGQTPVYSFSVGTKPTGFSTGSDFATTGSCTWANRTTTTGAARDAASVLTVTVTLNGETSVAKTCTSCVQEANSLGTTKYKNTNGTTGYNVSYGTPSVSIADNGFTASAGSAAVTCSVVNTVTWYQKYTSGSYDSMHTSTDGSVVANNVRWRITNQIFGTTSTATTGSSITRFANPTSGSSNLTIGGTATATYASGTKVSHSTMTTNEGYDIVTVTAYNAGDTSKSNTASQNVLNKVVKLTLTLGANAVMKDSDSHSSEPHYDLVYDKTCTTTVVAEYTSGSTDDNFTKATITSGTTTVATVS